MIRKTPTQVKDFLKKSLYTFDYPACYYGDEVNSYSEYINQVWDTAKVRYITMCPWSYEATPGNAAIPLMVQLMNDAGKEDGGWLINERCYFPCTKPDWKKFINAGVPSFGLESKHLATDFDILGFSIAYSPLIANCIRMLRDCEIPPRRKDRIDMKEPYPLIMAGGGTFSNPEFASAVVDIFWIGECEDEENSPGIIEFLKIVREYKEKGTFYTKEGRREFLIDAGKRITCLFIPSLMRPVYESKNKISHFEYDEGLKKPKRRFVRNLDNVPPLKAIPILYLRNGMGPGEVEVSRGCTGSCAFCTSCFRYRPYRERSVDVWIEAEKGNLKRTGALKAFPSSFDFTAMVQPQLLMKRSLEELSSDFDACGGRVDMFSKYAFFAKLMTEGGMDQLVLGIEGISQRLRDMVNKHCFTLDIIKAMRHAMENGYPRFKLYMISNLPTENESDVQAFIKLLGLIANLRDSYGQKLQINLSFTPLTIEANTPMQWFRTTLDERHLKSIVDPCHKLGLNFTFGGKANKDLAYPVQLMALGGRKVAELLAEVFIEKDTIFFGGLGGGVMEATGAKLKAQGMDWSDYFSGFSYDWIFPHEIIDSLVSKKYFIEYHKKMVKFLDENKDGEVYEKKAIERGTYIEMMSKCKDCKLCRVCLDNDYMKQTQEIRSRKDISVEPKDIKKLDQESKAQKVRLKLQKGDEYRFVSNDYYAFIIRRAHFMENMPITKRSVIFESSAARYRNWSVGVDYVELYFTREFLKKEGIPKYLEQINKHLNCARFVEAKLIGGQSIKYQSDFALWEIELDKSEIAVQNAVQEFNSGGYIELAIHEESYMKTGLERKIYNLSDMLSRLWYVKRGQHIILKMYLAGKCSPNDVYAALFRENWRKAMRYIPKRIEVFVKMQADQNDFFRLSCEECAENIPIDLMDKPFHSSLCPVCLDKEKLNGSS